MAAHENHAQFIVAKLIFGIGVIRNDGSRPRQFADNRVRLLAQNLVAAHGVDRRVVGHAKKPCPGVLRHALVGPCLESPKHGFLHRLFRQIQMRRTQQPRQARHHAPRLVPEQVFQQQTGLG